MVALKGSEAEAFIKRPNPGRPIALIFGPDAGLARERVGALLQASVDDVKDPFALVQLAGDDLATDPARLIDEATTIPLLGGRRAIWIKAGARNFTSAIESLLSVSLTDCRVVIEAGDLKRSSPLRGLCERSRLAVAISCYADGEKELARLIDDELRAANLRISRDARELLASSLGNDRQVSRAEIAKLVLYARGRGEIDSDDVLAVIADAASLALDQVVDAALAGRADDMETQLLRSRAAGATPAAMLNATLRQAMQLHAARLAIESNGPADQALERFFPGLHFRRKPLVEAALRSWTAARLLRATNQLAEAVRDSRKDSLLANILAERTLLSVTMAARSGRAR